MTDAMDYSLDSTEPWPRYTALWDGASSSSKRSFGWSQIQDSLWCHVGARAQRNRNCNASTCQVGTHECSRPCKRVKNTWMP